MFSPPDGTVYSNRQYSTSQCLTGMSDGSGASKNGGLPQLGNTVRFLSGDGHPASAQPPVPPRSNMLYHGALERRPLWQGNQLSRSVSSKNKVKYRLVVIERPGH